MLDLTNHTSQNGRILTFNDTIHLRQAQCIQRALLILRRTDTTLDLFDFYCCHDDLSSKYFFQRNTALLSNGTRITHFTQGKDGCLYKVMRVGRTLRLGQDILYTYALKNSTHGATGYHTGTRRCRKNQYLSTSEFGLLAMRHRTVNNRHAYKILFGRLYTFCNGGSDFAGLTQATSDDTFSVADNHDSGKRKSTTTLRYLDHAIDSNQSIF